MNFKKEGKYLFIVIFVFLVSYHLPIGNQRFDKAVFEALYLLKSYAREHVLLCLIPAFLIAGGVAIFISKDSVMRYLGAGAKKIIAYGVASVSGSILAVCSCTILPLFAGISRMGAGLGPATTFLYSGPAINIMAIILTSRVLGMELGIARAVGAILFSIIIGILMQLIFPENKVKSDKENIEINDNSDDSIIKNTLFFISLIGILVFANWGKPAQTTGFWFMVFKSKWIITIIMATGLATVMNVFYKISLWKIILSIAPSIITWFIYPDSVVLVFSIAILSFSFLLIKGNTQTQEWFDSSWEFAKQIMPLLFIGVVIGGFLLGRPGQEGIIPSEWIYKAVGGNSFGANLFAAIAGAFMYFATLTEVPILQGLISNGMGKGPALALLLAGPAISLPNMLVIRSVMGTRKTIVYILLVIVMSTLSGLVYGMIF